MKTTGRSKTYS